MSKVTLNSIGSRYGSLDALNDNFDQLEDAIDNTLSRDGTGPNSMEAPLDMGANPILNVSTLHVGSIVIGGQSLEPGEAVLAPSAIQVFEYVSTANQTSFSVAPFEVTSNSVEVEVNGVTLPPSTVSTSLTSVIIPAQPAGREVVIRVFTRDLGAAPAAGDVLYTPLSGNTRSIQVREREEYRVTDWGADPTGTADSTSAFTNAITYLESLDVTGGSNEGGRPTLHVPAGRYRTNSLTISKRFAIKGDGVGSTFIYLNSGQTTPLFIVNTQDIGGPALSLDDQTHTSISDLTLHGNRVDSTTTTSAHGISCPATAWALGTQYSPSIRLSNVNIYNFSGDGIFLGANRNWPFVENCIVRYNNGNGLSTYSYDGRFVSCDFGQHLVGYGVREFAGGANIFTGCNIYGNLVNIICNSASNSVSTWIGCAIDYATEDGVVLDQPTASKNFIGTRFFGNSRAGANLHSDIVATNCEVVVVGCSFTFATQKVKLLLETGGTTPKVEWLGNVIDTSGGASTPYQTGITDDNTVLRYAGDRLAYWGRAGASTLSAYVGGVEQMRVLANGPYTAQTARLFGSLSAQTNYAAAQTATLTNAPVSGNPTKWLAIDDAGTTRYVPVW